MRGQHGTQGTRAGGAHHGARRVLRPPGDDEGPGPGGEGRADVLGQRPLVVDANRDRPQAEGGDEVEQAAPARVLDGDRVPGSQMGGEHPFDRVERSGGHDHGSVRHTVRVQFRAGDPGQFRLHRVLPVEHGGTVGPAGGRRERLTQGGQERGVGVAVGEVAHPFRDLDPDVLPGSGRRLRPDPAAAPPVGLDDPAFPQGAVGGRDGVRIHPE